MREVKICEVKMDGVSPVFILGPCVIESEEFAWEMGKALNADWLLFLVENKNLKRP